MIHRHGTVSSTQDLAHELAAGGAAHGTAVVAVAQTGGRGTRGRQWTSGPGGLWCSVVLRPHPTVMEGLSLRIGLRLAPALDPLVDPEHRPIRLKWPNDLIAADRKLGGILAEARWLGAEPGWVVVGVGINVTNHLDPAVAPSAIRLADLGPSRSVDALVEPVVAAVTAGAGQGGAFSEDELAEFAERDWVRGRRVEGTATGTAVGITPDGRLLVDTGHARVAVAGAVVVSGLAGGLPSR